MKRLTLLTTVLAAGAVLLTGCGGAPTAAPTPMPTAIPTVQTATVAQYASLVAREKSDFVATIDKLLDSDTCALTSPGRVEVNSPGLCNAYAVTAGLQAMTLSVTLTGAKNPDAQMYVGEPPQEIKPLVTSAVTAADQVSATQEAAQECFTSNGDGCTTKLFDFYRALTDMRSEFNAWNAYAAG